MGQASCQLWSIPYCPVFLRTAPSYSKQTIPNLSLPVVHHILAHHNDTQTPGHMGRPVDA